MSDGEISWFVVQSAFALWFFVSVNASIIATSVLLPWVRRKSEAAVREWPALAVVVPCYLPNEEAIIVDTLEAIAASSYDGRLDIVVPYNSPRQLAVEQQLATLERVHGRSVLCHKVCDSTSKAENVMYALEELISDDVKVVVIFDADHHPEPYAIERMVRVLLAYPKSACAQGAVHVARGGPPWLRWVVGGMEWVSWNFYAPGISVLVGSAWFAGGNAAWRREDLQELGLNTNTLTEDVDISVRCMMEARRIQIVPWSRVNELCPPSLMAFLRQRARWAVGWEQVMLQYAGRIARCDLRFCGKMRVYMLLLPRYVGALSSIFMVSNLISTTLMLLDKDQRAIALPIAVLSSITGHTSAWALFAILLSLAYGGYGLECTLKVLSFLCIGLPYAFFQLVLVIYAWAKLLCCAVTWVPTARAANAEVHRIKVARNGQARRRAKHLRLPDAIEAAEEA